MFELLEAKLSGAGRSMAGKRDARRMLTGGSSLLALAAGLAWAGPAVAGSPEAARQSGTWVQLAQAAELEQVAQTAASQATQQERRQLYEPPRRGETVRSRPKPELEPLGVRLGSFFVLPNIELSETYDDNIFATDNSTESDFITTIRPEVEVRSNWGRHEVSVQGYGELGYYADNGSEDYKDYGIGAGARLDVLRDAYVLANLGYQHLHEDRGSPDDVAGSEPTEYDVIAGGLSGTKGFGRFNATLGVNATDRDYEDVPAAGGAIIDQDDRDRNEYEGYGRLGYVIQPQYEAFVRAAYNIRDYDQKFDNAGFERSSDGYQVVGGVALDLGGLVFGDFFAGWQAQDYDDPALDDASGFSVGADIDWNVTSLVTINAVIQRTIEETTIANASSYTATEGRLRADWELLRNLIVTGGVGYELDSYDGISRDDNIFGGNIGAIYNLNRNFYISGRYDYTQRSSDAAGEDYDRNRVLLLVGAQL